MHGGPHDDEEAFEMAEEQSVEEGGFEEITAGEYTAARNGEISAIHSDFLSKMEKLWEEQQQRYRNEILEVSKENALLKLKLEELESANEKVRNLQSVTLDLEGKVAQLENENSKLSDINSDLTTRNTSSQAKYTKIFNLTEKVPYELAEFLDWMSTITSSQANYYNGSQRVNTNFDTEKSLLRTKILTLAESLNEEVHGSGNETLYQIVKERLAKRRIALT